MIRSGKSYISDISNKDIAILKNENIFFKKNKINK